MLSVYKPTKPMLIMVSSVTEIVYAGGLWLELGLMCYATCYYLCY